MQDDLLNYYERELSYLRQMGQEFSQAYPKIASRLQLEAGKCEDPHVERLIQAFAFLAARIHRKIDDEFPEITDALLGILYPHYLAPLPSMSIVQFELDPEQGKLTTGYPIKRGTQLFSKPVQGTQCRFRTCYDTTLWPITVVSAKFEPFEPTPGGPKAVSVLRLELRCQGGGSFQELDIERLRFYLHGEARGTYAMYELLLNHVCEIRIKVGGGRSGAKQVPLPPHCLQPVGFASDEGLLPYPMHAFMGYRLIQEYFVFPQKYMFVELTGLKQVMQGVAGDRMEIVIAVDQAPNAEQSAIDPGMFRLGCTPIVNLFEKIAEPIRIDQTQYEYRVVPDLRKPYTTEVYSVDEVLWTAPHMPHPQFVQPFYSLKHGADESSRDAFWFAARKPSERKNDPGTEIWLTLVDRSFDPALPPAETLSVQVTCTNRDLPGKLPFSEERGDFELEGAAPLSKIRALVKPTQTMRLPLTGEHQWRLISHLSLNYLSLVEGGEGALREILGLYDFTGSAVTKQQISGIANVTTRRVVRRPETLAWNGFCRGLEVTIEFDGQKYVGTGVFLFASVLERFISLYAAVNTFTQLVATIQQREEPIKRWPPRVGEQMLL